MIATETYPSLPELKAPGRYQIMCCPWIESLGQWGNWHRVATVDEPDGAEARKKMHADTRAVRNTYGGLLSRSDGIRVYRVFDRHGWKQVGKDTIL